MIAARGWEEHWLLKEYDGVGMGHMLIRRARMNPASTALRFEDLSLTYKDLEQNIVSLAQALKNHGLEPGDRIGYLGLNDPKFLEVLYASALIGAIFVPINYRLTAQEIAFIANDAGLKMLFADEPSAAQLESGLEGRRCDCLIGVNFESATWLPLKSELPESGGATDALEIAHPVKADDVVMIMYTSGTTGRPKGATLNARQYLLELAQREIHGRDHAPCNADLRTAFSHRWSQRHNTSVAGKWRAGGTA